MYFVVGSGPSGISVASALIDAGREVTLLDAGMQCEPARLRAAQRLADLPPEKWTDEMVAAVRGPSSFDPGQPKLLFGSSFPYAHTAMAEMVQQGTKCLVSHARGGLSNVWGAAVLPNPASEFERWPVSYEEMTPHYEAVARLLGISGDHDDLETILPYFVPPEPPLQPSRQAQTLLSRMQKDHAVLASAGFRFGKARLAVRTQSTSSGAGCLYAGLCLSGCPYGAIWNAAGFLAELQQRGLRYQSGLRLRRVESPGGDAVRLYSIEETSGREVVLEGERVFLATGPLSTAGIIIDSLAAYERTFALQFQPYFLLPMLAHEHTPGVRGERLHTLSQLFLELTDPKISSNPVHLQIYSYNDLIRRRVDAVTRFLPGREWIREHLLGRLLVIQGYLHSAESPPIRLTGRRDGARHRLVLESPDRQPSRSAIQRVVRHLRQYSDALGARPLLPFLRMGEPGEGNHVGGLFPMRRSPAQFETATLGRLPGLARVHLVDGSILPALAATTFTYTTMANAHRIACAVSGEEQA